MTWDYEYEGSGNWPFNTAYAGSFSGIDARVTRLHSSTRWSASSRLASR